MFAKALLELTRMEPPSRIDPEIRARANTLLGAAGYQREQASLTLMARKIPLLHHIVMFLLVLGMVAAVKALQPQLAAIDETLFSIRNLGNLFLRGPVALAGSMYLAEVIATRTKSKAFLARYSVVAPYFASACFCCIGAFGLAFIVFSGS